MTKTLIIKMEFPRGIHLGKNKLSDAEMTLRADTMFSALCHEALSLEDQGIKKLLNLVDQGLRISDGFPYYKDQYFLPKPILTIRNEDTDSSQRKLFKSIDYISLDKWEDYLSGQSDPQDLIGDMDKLDNFKVFTKINYDLEGNHDIYNMGVRYFKKDSGLYFIIICPDEGEEYMDELLYSLSLSGLGGKRRVGVGSFDFTYGSDQDIQDFDKYLEGQWGYWVSLTTGLPKSDESQVLQEALGYHVIRRGGFVASPSKLEGPARRKKDIFMLSSGSVFKSKFEGDIYDVSAGYGHPVYQYAMPIFMGVDL